MTEQDPPALVSHVFTERRRNTIGDMGVLPSFEEVLRNSSGVRVVRVRMHGRHFYDDKAGRTQTVFHFNNEYIRSSGVDRFKSAVIVHIHDPFRADTA